MNEGKISTMRFAFLRRHSKFQDQVDAYLDGELSTAENNQFEIHIARCDSCAAAVRDGRELKAMFSSLAPVESPRSFGLTPAMVAGIPVRPQPARQPALALRFAQITAGVAIMALAAVAVADFTGGNSGSNGDQRMASDGGAENSAKSAPEAASTAGPATSGAGALDRGASPPAALPTPIGSGVEAQGNGTPVGPSPVSNLTIPAANPFYSDSPAGAAPLADAVESAPEVAPRPGDGVAESGLRLAEGGLLALFAIAATTWFLLARRSRGFLT
ncbi:MAG: hypothetical protein C0506_13255 [Anaerolinea sp.]|nr:hypothetical protein [Anaerolinea sp.]